MERYMRITQEYIDDLKERAINNYEHIKMKFVNNEEKDKEEKQD